MCGSPTWGPNDRPYSATNIGQAAHIAAAAVKGPRYVEEMSPEERSSITNGIWLCSNCHDKVDRNVDTYTIAILKDLKEKAENKAKLELGVATSSTRPVNTIHTYIHTYRIPCTNFSNIISSQDGGVLDQCVSATTIVEIRKARAQLSDYHGKSVGWSEAERVFSALDFINLDQDSYLPQVGKELLLLMERMVVYSSDSEVRLEVIRRVKEIVDQFHSNWEEEEVKLTSQMMVVMAEQYSPSNMVFQSSAALLKDLSQQLGRRNATLGNMSRKNLQKLLKNAKRKKRRTMGSEEVDSDMPGVQMGISEGPQDTIELEEYLDKMEDLANLTEDVDGPHGVRRCLNIEQEIKRMGFEPNIL